MCKMLMDDDVCRFPSGYGLFMFLQGNITFAVGPIVGYIRDVTGSYTISFHCLTLFMAMCVLPWLFEIVYLRLKARATGRGEQNVAAVPIPAVKVETMAQEDVCK
uniref:(northern house mosquito) hypothetical protein n=1 Tax=Culex pipiens TaxID=7175 RepID=A0A8D7ZWK4_CULPI